MPNNATSKQETYKSAGQASFLNAKKQPQKTQNIDQSTNSPNLQ
jgi:hypothetical protein